MSFEILETFAGALTGTLISAWIAKAYIAKSLSDLREAHQKINEITRQLAVIEEKLRGIDDMGDLLMEHDRKIVMLEARRKNVSSRDFNGHS